MDETRTPGRRVRCAVAPFGLVLEQEHPGGPPPDRPALEALASLGGGRVALVTGASGSGKSTLVRALAALLDERGSRVERVGAGAFTRASRPAVEVVGGPLAAAMRAMGAAGLGEAGLFARAAGRLSEGERWRLALARAMVGAERAEGGVWLIADEFCSTLDRATAQSVAVCTRRWAACHPRVRVVCATAHEDMEAMLGPELLVRVAPGGSSGVEAGRPRRRSPAVRIERGSIEDYDALGDRHYRAGRPATWTRVLRASRSTPHGRLLAGVLVASHPTLNAAWRDLPWPGRYTSGDKRARARRLNRELRRLSRVVVEPRSRGMGIARRLVGAYLRDPETPATEALAAMGAVCPFLERAGMRAYRVGVRDADARLEDALAHAGIDADELIVGVRADVVASDRFVARELRRWADSSRATRGLLAQGGGRIARAAGARLCNRPIGYAHVIGGG